MTTSAVSQKQGVYNAVQAFCEENELHFEDGMHFNPTKEQRSEIVHMVAGAMEAGEIQLSSDAASKYDTPEKLKSYCNGLVSNWLRKDTRLNGGEKYEIKNPGSRAGSGDQVIKELRKLKKTLTDAEQIAAVEEEIEKRLASIQAEKAKSVEINVDLIPEELKGLVSNS